MSWTESIVGMAEALGFALPDLILLMTGLGCLILFAKDLKVGLVSMFMLFAVEFIIFSNLGWDTSHVILIMFIAMALMAISFFTGARGNVLN